MSSDQIYTLDSCPGCRAVGSDPARHPGFGAAGIHRCRACGTEFASPQPSDERLSEIYSAEYYDAWHIESPEALRSMKALSFAPLVEEIERGGGTKVLDVGCARGEFLRTIDRPGYELFGVDRNAAAIDAAAIAVPSAAFHAAHWRTNPSATSGSMPSR